MESLVVSDTNIFIDLVKLNILDDLFHLPWEIHTTDFVMDELTDVVQFDAVNSQAERGRLHVGHLSADEVEEILKKSSCGGCRISPTDFSIILYAKKNHFCVLSGDGPLRKYAEGEGIEVRGILYVFKALVENSILPQCMAAELLEKLKTINRRLPIETINELINTWKT